MKYPPDKQEKATQTVLEQAELLAEQWSTAKTDNSRLEGA